MISFRNLRKAVVVLAAFGLAAVMFTGCQQNVDIETDKVELSDGTWDYTLTASFFTEKKWPILEF